jgi:hypothetical protein
MVALLREDIKEAVYEMQDAIASCREAAALLRGDDNDDDGYTIIASHLLSCAEEIADLIDYIGSLSSGEKCDLGPCTDGCPICNLGG